MRRLMEHLKKLANWISGNVLWDLLSKYWYLLLSILMDWGRNKLGLLTNVDSLLFIVLAAFALLGLVKGVIEPVRKTFPKKRKNSLLTSNLKFPPSSEAIKRLYLVNSETITKYPILRSTNWKQILEKAHQWTMNDQISETGGWGKSHVNVIETASNTKMTELEKEEGGIYSTFVALRGLLAYSKSYSSFQQLPNVQKAYRYLLARQTKRGGFGRFVHSRSGVELHPSLRHTAFAIASLLDLGGPPHVINDGLVFIDSWPKQAFKDDAAPSEAVAAILNVIRRVKQEPGYLAVISEDIISMLEKWGSWKRELFGEFINFSAISPYRPFWEPYGSYETMLYDTALTTIDLIADDFPPYVENVITQILSGIMSKKKGNGIPKTPWSDHPDIGMTAFFLSIVLRPSFLGRLSDRLFLKRLEKETRNLLKFLNDEYENSDYWEYTYCDTLPNLLRLSAF